MRISIQNLSILAMNSSAIHAVDCKHIIGAQEGKKDKKPIPNI